MNKETEILFTVLTDIFVTALNDGDKKSCCKTKEYKPTCHFHSVPSQTGLPVPGTVALPHPAQIHH